MPFVRRGHLPVLVVPGVVGHFFAPAHALNVSALYGVDFFAFTLAQSLHPDQGLGVGGNVQPDLGRITKTFGAHTRLAGNSSPFSLRTPHVAPGAASLGQFARIGYFGIHSNAFLIKVMVLLVWGYCDKY